MKITFEIAAGLVLGVFVIVVGTNGYQKFQERSKKEREDKAIEIVYRSKTWKLLAQNVIQYATENHISVAAVQDSFEQIGMPCYKLSDFTREDGSVDVWLLHNPIGPDSDENIKWIVNPTSWDVSYWIPGEGLYTDDQAYQRFISKGPMK